MAIPVNFLGQGGAVDWVRIAIPVVVLAALLVVGVFAWRWARRAILGKPDAAESEFFSLEQLRDLRDRNEISEEQFRRLRSRVIEHMTHSISGVSDADTSSAQSPGASARE